MGTLDWVHFCNDDETKATKPDSQQHRRNHKSGIYVHFLVQFYHTIFPLDIHSTCITVRYLIHFSSTTLLLLRLLWARVLLLSSSSQRYTRGGVCCLLLQQRQATVPFYAITARATNLIFILGCLMLGSVPHPTN